MDYKNSLVSLVLGSTIVGGCISNQTSLEGSKLPTGEVKKIKTKVSVNKNNDLIYGISPEDRDMLVNSTVKIKAEYTLELKIGDIDSIMIVGASGSGVAVLNEETQRTYILTADHVLPTEKELCLRRRGCLKVLKTRLSVEDHLAEIVKRNETFDLALIRLSGNFIKQHYTGGLAEEVKDGEKAVSVGYTNGYFKTFHAGHIASIDLGEYLKKYIDDDEAKAEFTNIKDLYDVFGIPKYTVFDTHGGPGDSGSGVYVLNNNKPKLAGLWQVGYTFTNGLRGMSPIKVLTGFVDDTVIGPELGCKTLKY